MAWDRKVQFDEDGKPMTYDHGAPDWRDNDPFNDALSFMTFGRGRPSVTAIFHSGRLDCKVEMFLSEFEEVLVAGHLVDLTLVGSFDFAKRGRNFGIRRIGPRVD